MRCAQEKTEAKWCPCSPPILNPSSPSSAHRAIIGNKASNRTAVDLFHAGQSMLKSPAFLWNALKQSGKNGPDPVQRAGIKIQPDFPQEHIAIESLFDNRFGLYF